MAGSGFDSDTIGRSHIWLFDYYQELSCFKAFNKYDRCIQKHGDPSKCEDENRKSGDCVSGFWHSLSMECRPMIGKESIDESGLFKPEFVGKFDSCLKDITKKDVSSNSILMASNPESDMNLEASLPILGILFARRACAKASESYKSCRRSYDAHSCVDAGKEFAICNMNYAKGVIPNCINAVTSFYQAKLAQDEKATPPSDKEVSREYFKCLVASQSPSS